jgi:hypothetical protein
MWPSTKSFSHGALTRGSSSRMPPAWTLSWVPRRLVNLVGWPCPYPSHMLSHVLSRNRLQDAARPELRLPNHTQQTTSHQGMDPSRTLRTLGRVSSPLMPFSRQVVVPDEGSLFTHLINNWAFQDLSKDGTTPDRLSSDLSRP